MKPLDPNPNCRGLPINWDDLNYVDQHFYGYRFDTHSAGNVPESPACTSCPTCGHQNDPETCWYHWAGHGQAWRCVYCGTMVPEIDRLLATIERLTKERDEARDDAADWRAIAFSGPEKCPTTALTDEELLFDWEPKERLPAVVHFHKHGEWPKT